MITSVELHSPSEDATVGVKEYPTQLFLDLGLRGGGGGGGGGGFQITHTAKSQYSHWKEVIQL